MIDGITILNKYELTSPVANRKIHVISYVLLCISILSCITSVIVLKAPIFVVAFSMCLLVISYVLFLMYGYTNRPNGKFCYLVKIDKTVSMTEFFSLYEVISYESSTNIDDIEYLIKER